MHSLYQRAIRWSRANPLGTDGSPIRSDEPFPPPRRLPRERQSGTPAPCRRREWWSDPAPRHCRSAAVASRVSSRFPPDPGLHARPRCPLRKRDGTVFRQHWCANWHRPHRSCESSPSGCPARRANPSLDTSRRASQQSHSPPARPQRYPKTHRCGHPMRSHRLHSCPW